MKSKNKLVPRLLGITKESVMRVDERTKDVVQEWPLTTVKRWAASPKSFTLVRHTGRPPARVPVQVFFVLRALSFKYRKRKQETDLSELIPSPQPPYNNHCAAVGGVGGLSFQSLVHFII